MKDPPEVEAVHMLTGLTGLRMYGKASIERIGQLSLSHQSREKKNIQLHGKQHYGVLR